MRPRMCTRCKKNVAVIYVTKVENGVTTNEGLCLKCARELNIGPVQDLMDRLNLTDEDLDNISEEMVEGFQLCPMGNEFDSEAYGKCSCKDVHVELSDVTIQDYARLAKKNNTTVFFKGRMAFRML